MDENIFDITSDKNSTFKRVKSLDTKKWRNKYKEFTVEGVSSVEEIIDSNYEISEIFISLEFLHKEKNKVFYENIVNNSEKDNFKIYKISNKLFADLSYTDTPQGVLAVVKQKELNYKDVINNIESKKQFIIICEEIQDPGNLGTIIRCADAFNVDAVILTKGCVDVFNPKVIRSTMGSIFHLPVCTAENIEEMVEYIKERKIKIIASSLRTNQNICKLRLQDSLAFIIGNEAKGVSEKMLDLCDETVKIHIPGNANSLNASVAAGIIMFEVIRQRME